MPPPPTFDYRLQTPGLERDSGRINAKKHNSRALAPALFMGLWWKTASVSVSCIFNLYDAAVYPGRPLV